MLLVILSGIYCCISEKHGSNILAPSPSFVVKAHSCLSIVTYGCKLVLYPMKDWLKIITKLQILGTSNITKWSQRVHIVPLAYLKIFLFFPAS